MRKLLATVALAALLAGGAAVAPAQAAPLHLDDKRGDALDGRASFDITRVTFDVRQINRGGPPSLVYEMTLAAPPENQFASYSIEADAGSCFIDASFRPGTVFATALASGAADFFVGCDDHESELLPAKTLVKDNVITMSVATDSLPKEARTIRKLENLYAFTQTAEPVFGIFGNGDQDLGQPGVLPTDSVESDKTYSF